MAATKFTPPRSSQLPRSSSSGRRQIRPSPISKSASTTTTATATKSKMSSNTKSSLKPTKTSRHFPQPTTTTTGRNISAATLSKPNSNNTPNASNTTTTSSSATQRKQPTPYQRLVYAHLLCIPPGRVTSYLALSHAVSAAKTTHTHTNADTEPKRPSPRAIGGALRVNPFAPVVPCHRVIASSGYVGGFKGEWEDAPSGVNQVEKLALLDSEGVGFDGVGRLQLPSSLDAPGGKGKDGRVWFSGPWPFEEYVAEVERLCRGLQG